MVIIGAIVTLVNAPKPGKPTAPADEPEDSNDLEQVEVAE
jgi:hypothetical protein